MPRKKKRVTLNERMVGIKRAGLNSEKPWIKKEHPTVGLSIKDIYKKVMEEKKKFVKSGGQKVMFFLMYDISETKVRTIISKYLIRQGMIRIQKSVFFGHLDRRIYREIKQTMVESNEVYKNEDSVVLVPATVDSIEKMALIGKNVNMDIEINEPSIMFL